MVGEAKPTIMSNYRRNYVPGGTYFFTVVTHSRASLFRDSEACRILGDVLRQCQKQWPFEVNAIVLLPEHLHALWSLPSGDASYPRRWAWIKKEFTKAWLATGGVEQVTSHARRQRGDRGIWQPRYWEHTIEDENDYERHFDYIHYNPVKHGHVKAPCHWPYSSFQRWVKQEIYPSNWGSLAMGEFKFDDLDETAMEME